MGPRPGIGPSGPCLHRHVMPISNHQQHQTHDCRADAAGILFSVVGACAIAQPGSSQSPCHDNTARYLEGCSAVEDSAAR